MVVSKDKEIESLREQLETTVKQSKRKLLSLESKNDQTKALLEDKVAHLERQIQEKSQREVSYMDSFNQ